MTNGQIEVITAVRRRRRWNSSPARGEDPFTGEDPSTGVAAAGTCRMCASAHSQKPVFRGEQARRPA
jgi:hypothetical protein